ncbi:MAG: addiction module protein [Desulfoprunum sp.]|jgi:putative addiction module component (TIGR02574 family)|uniref:addiction module protein n=1 Tax=Desulfoprunum sp. TaxID=2020866 RepID=UPI00052C1CE4|nr:addiction module protein [Desulfobulbus sp. Tol-SR]
MRGKDILKEALNLEPAEKFIVVEGLLKSLDEPDSELDKIWADEAERRLEAYRDGKLKGIPMEQIFNPLK